MGCGRGATSQRRPAIQDDERELTNAIEAATAAVGEEGEKIGCADDAITIKVSRMAGVRSPSCKYGQQIRCADGDWRAPRR